jgi:ketosteroid isomerase-like protein
MSQEILERWRLLYSAVSRGDLDGIMEFFHEDVEYLPFEESEAIHGLDAVRLYFEGWLDTWDSFQAEPTEFLARDDHVVVGEAFRGRGKDSGVEVTMQSWSASLLRDDRIVRRDEFLNRAEALEAAGLSPD